MYRTVNCEIWGDPWFEELGPLEKLLFVNLVTNTKQTGCGVFEITVNALAFETGIDKQYIPNIMERLADKVSWWPGWERFIGAPLIPPGIVKKEPTPKATIPQDIRWAVWERDNFTCLHCGTRRDLSVDHIIPESKGGPLTLGNLQTLCRPCNSRKGNRQ